MNIPFQRFQTLVGCTLLVSLFLSVGCSSKDKKLSLSGKVTYKGEPVPGGTITFAPTDGKTPPTKIQLGGDGTYLIVPPAPGKLKVAIETESVRALGRGSPTSRVIKGADGKERIEKLPDSQQQSYKPIPIKYSQVETSGLSVDVQAGKNEKNFDLTD